MAVRNLRGIQPIITIPSSASPNYKVTIERDGGTVDTVTDDILKMNVVRAGTNALSSFSLTLNNSDGQYLGLYNGGEYVNIYIDYSDATTLYLRCRVDKYNYSMDASNGFVLKLDGRQYPEIADRNITIQFTNTDLIHALIGITGDADDQGIKSDGILYNTGLWWHSDNPTEDDNNTKITYNYMGYSILKALSDISVRGDYDWYIYYDAGTSKWYIRLFPENDITNTDENVAYGVNVERVPGIGKDFDTEFNRVRVYGEEDENIFYLKTVNNTTSQSNLWVKDKKVNDTKINNSTEMDDRAEYEYAAGEAVIKGGITALPLVTLHPGEMVHVDIPYCGLNNETYKIVKITTNLGSTGLRSELDIEESKLSIADIFKELIDEDEALSPYINLNDMDYSYVIDFGDGSVGTHSSTTVNDGKLQLTTPGAGNSGTWISPVKSASGSVSSVELRLKANYDIDSSTFYVSGDSGVTWNEVSLGVLYDYGTLGTNLVVKITLNGVTNEPNPKVEKVCLLYK